MVPGNLGVLIREIRRLAAPPDEGTASDGQLLQRFAAERDADAFAALVRRHGPMVLGVCRRILRHAQDAEDAFQATFLALVRQARSINERESVAGWLYRVAYRVAMKARTSNSRRTQRERNAAQAVPPRTDDEAVGRELFQVLDEELHQLPDKYRDLAVLCYLEGKPQAEAARELGFSKATASQRLSRARRLLQGRLSRRGLVLSTTFLASLLGPGRTLASVPVGLAHTTVDSGLRLLAGELAGAVSAHVLQLVDFAGKAGLAVHTKLLAILLLGSLMVGGAAAVSTPSHTPREAEEDITTAVQPPAKAPPPSAARADANIEEADADTDPDSFDPQPRPFQALPLQMWGLAFSSDGKTLAVACGAPQGAGGVQIWDVAQGTLRRHIAAANGIRGVAYSRDGKVLASADYFNKSATIRDAATGKVRHDFQHAGAVNAVALSPDSRYLATASLDGALMIWDLTTGQSVHKLAGHAKGGVFCIAFNSAGTMLASAGADLLVRVWDMSTGKELRALKGHDKAIEALAFAPTGDTLASASWDKSIKLWNAADGGEIGSMTGHQLPILTLAFSPDGKQLASGSGKWGDPQIPDQPGEVKLWDVASRKEVASFAGHTDRVFAVAFSPDGKTLASAGWDKTIKLWDVALRKERRTLGAPLAALEPQPILAAASDGKVLALASEDKTVRVHDLATGDLRLVLTGHDDVVTCLAFSPDGKLLATGSPDRNIKLWDLGTGKELRTLKGHTNWVYALAFAPDGKLLASGGYDKTVRLWDPATGMEQGRLTAHKASVRALAFTADGKTLVSAGGDRLVRVWDVAAREQRAALRGHEAGVRALAFSPTEGTLASAGEDGIVKLWDLAAGKEQRSLKAANEVWSLAFSPRGRLLVGGTLDGSIAVWDPLTGETRELLRAHQEAVTGLTFHSARLLSTSLDRNVLRWQGKISLPPPLTLKGNPRGAWFAVFSPAGDRLVTGGEGGTVTLWSRTLVKSTQSFVSQPGVDAAFAPDGRSLALPTNNIIHFCDPRTGQVRRKLLLDRPVRTLAFSPDGKYFAVGAGTWKDGNTPPDIRLYDAADLQELARLEGHTSMTFCLRFSPDSKLLASTSRDNTIRVWEVPSGKLHTVLRGHETPARGMAFLPDGTLVTASWDKTIRFWDLDGGRETRVVNAGISLVALAVSPDGKQLAAAEPRELVDQPATLKVWDVATGKEKRQLKGHTSRIIGLAFSADGRGLVAVGGKLHGHGEISYWDLPTGRHRTTQTSGKEIVENIVFTPDGGRALATSAGGSSLWDLTFGERERAWPAHATAVSSGIFLDHGRMLATGCWDSSVKLWNLQDGKLLGTFAGHEKGVRALAACPDGKTLATASQDGTVRLWDLATRKEKRALRASAPVYCLAVHPKGKLLVSGGGNIGTTTPGELILWDLETGERRRTFNGLEREVWSVAFSPDGKTLVSGNRPGTIRVWDVETGEQRALLAAPDVRPLAFSADGSLLAAGLGKATAKGQVSAGIVRIWETRTWRERASLPGHQNMIFSVAFAPDGRALASASKDGTVRIWPIPRK